MALFSEMMDERCKDRALIEKLVGALLSSPCPHLANGVVVETYDDLTVKACIGRLECGCDSGAALSPAESRLKPQDTGKG